jgi:hypothetical protein
MSTEAFADNGCLSSGLERGAAAPHLVEISNSIVRLYKEAFGRGPTKARTMFAGRDTLVVVLEKHGI